MCIRDRVSTQSTGDSAMTTMATTRTLLVLLTVCAVGHGADLGADLMAAAGHGKHDEVQQLLEQDASIANYATVEGETPLHVSCISGKPDLVRLLLAAGGAVDARAFGEHSLKMTPLSWCVFGGFKEAVEVLVTEGKADVNKVFLDESGKSITVMDVCRKIGDDQRNEIAAFLKEAGALTFEELAEQTKGHQEL
eukprot:TRINITY_DN14420_c0_g1_i2.p1 TRINITY_DN14420_c0_g1~~TRINITY_DN14420_c0_g1_i2.p1  ORF type:complete len:194 (+),score=55.54 TRINITY_DN14420_c0_g1_i2:117-698(+)